MSFDDDEAIRVGYERYGVEGFYQRFGASYRNPHEPAVRAAIRRAVERWGIPVGKGARVLDLACGSGEATLALRELGCDRIDAVDPYTAAAYTARTGAAAERLTFEQIAAGGLAGRQYDTIVCSFALHLVAASRLPTLALHLGMAGAGLLIITPHKRPQMRPEWGWSLVGELVVERVRARYYRSALSATNVAENS
jgi:2-polyprenyl-3-methyl-5-hydroxy-6-metoxy-1,4-benzoquinol methylase